jgi:hypothetical protein
MDTKNKYKVMGLIILAWMITLTGVSQDKKDTKKIKYTSFTVITKQHKVELEWATDNSVSTNYFEVQKSSDGKNYKTIALVLGPDPKKPGCDCYDWFDTLMQKTNTYYRLKHIDANGSAQISEPKLLAGS